MSTFLGLVPGQTHDDASRRKALWLADVERDARWRREWLDAIEATGLHDCYSEADAAAIGMGEALFERIAKLAATQVLLN